MKKMWMVTLLLMITAILTGCGPTHITIEEDSSSIDSASVVYETPVTSDNN
ncbi:MAG: hypothetical protein IJ779_00850 [Ruminococcus sp.]|nr:hypothetical protein [Ruminococcus sp.]